MVSNKIVNLDNPTSDQDAATRFYVNTSIPIGGIIMWSGSISSLPNNWKFCDGTNGTPDLRGRFVLSSGQGSGLTNRTTGQTGGVETVTLTEEQMPTHKHGVSAETNETGGHSHTASVTDPGHNHQQGSGRNGSSSGPWWGFDIYGYSPVVNTETNTTGISVSIDTKGVHKHTITVTETSKGSGTAHENMPPFYVLAFIMRVS